jgi:hypothetical protein
MKMLRYIPLLILALALISCEESIELDVDQTPSKIVIEGLVTNRPGYQSVKISRSTDFYGSGQSPRVTDATVQVADDAGGEYSFVHNPRNHPDSMGIYLPALPFVGAIGRTYTLQVVVGGEAYVATDKMFAVTTIDSLTFQVNDDQQEDPEEEGKVYEMLIYAKEPQDENNYYLFKYYRNDSVTVFNQSDVYYTDDELLGENISGIPSPVYFGVGDKAGLEVYSLTRNGYVFYNDLSTLLTNDGGGMFGPIPAPPRTNLSNDALGFFQVSAIDSKEVLIEEL